MYSCTDTQLDILFRSKTPINIHYLGTHTNMPARNFHSIEILHTQREIERAAQRNSMEIKNQNDDKNPHRIPFLAEPNQTKANSFSEMHPTHRRQCLFKKPIQKKHTHTHQYIQSSHFCRRVFFTLCIGSAVSWSRKWGKMRNGTLFCQFQHTNNAKHQFWSMQL